LIIPKKYLHALKFIVVADARTGEELAIYFNHLLPDMHRELLKAARAVSYTHLTLPTN
jgi:hypothetical protein